MSPEMLQFRKVERVITSCVTRDQFAVARNFYRLYLNAHHAWYDGAITGAIELILKIKEAELFQE